MLVIALDVSTKTGWAVFKDGNLVEYGTLFPDKTHDDFNCSYPINYLLLCRYLSRNLLNLFDTLVHKHRKWQASEPLEVVVEETNAGRQNYSQKKLEYLHYLVNTGLEERSINAKYIRDGSWKTITGARQGPEEKKLNAEIAKLKKSRNAAIDKDKTLDAKAKKAAKKLPVKIDGKITGKKGKKDYAIRVANETFGLKLIRKDEDAADAILLGLGFIKGAPICDGTVKGGKMKKE